MDPHSPNKLIATKYCSLILGDDTSFFFLSLIILVLFLCYVIFIHFVIINFYKIELLLLLLLLLLLIYLWNFFFSCSRMFRILSTPDQRDLGPFFTSYHQDRCQEIKFFVGSTFSGFYLLRNLPVKGLNKEYYIWSAVLVVQNNSVETHLLREYCTFAQPLFCFKASGTMRSRSITFKARLFWFMAHRTRNITVEAFYWSLFEFLYGLYSLVWWGING